MRDVLGCATIRGGDVPKFPGAVLILVALLSATAYAQVPPSEQTLRSQAEAAMAAKNWPQAADAYRKLAALSPKAEYFLGLGNAEINRGQNEVAADAYLKGYKTSPSDRVTESALLTGLGNAYAKLRRQGEAVVAYERAAAVSPTPGLAWFNVCAVRYNMGQMKDALQACDKSIKADPSRADAYFVKGSILYGDAKVGANSKIILPAGTLEALQEYLQLAPNGPHASDVKQMLDAAK